MVQIISGGLTAVPGIKASGISCGLKKKNKKDLGIIFSEVPASAAAVFTTNLIKAAPVLVSRRNIKEKETRAVVVNSGNANACSGQRGMEDAGKMVVLTAEALNLKPEQVLVSSTGVIGRFLPMDKVEKGIKMAVQALSEEGGTDLAEAILTTDTIKKEIACSFEISGKKVTIGATAKGSGMIYPNMATMLAFLTTDVKISKQLLEEALKESVLISYNLITVDGDTSTNDMVVILANGLADNPEITEKGEDYRKFLTALNYVNREMSRMIIRDGEGTTKLIEVTVKNVVDYEMGRKLSMGILNSNLVKTAFFGEDANWGRIITAMGYSCKDFIPEKVDIFLGDLQVMKDGVGLIFDEDKAKEILSHREIKVLVDLKLGSEAVTAWGSDLSHRYVDINSSYRT